MSNMAFFAGPSEEGHVKIWDHIFIYFVVAPKDWISWVRCVQEGRLIEKDSSGNGFFYVVRRGCLGG